MADGDQNDLTVVGAAGEGTLSIFDGGRAESAVATIGQQVGVSGEGNVSDGNALAHWNIGGSLYAGGSDS